MKTEDGSSNLSELVALSNASGYHVVTGLVNSARYGTPAQRTRYYLVGILVSSDPIDQESDDYEDPEWADRMEQTILDMAGISGNSFCLLCLCVFDAMRGTSGQALITISFDVCLKWRQAVTYD